MLLEPPIQSQKNTELIENKLYIQSYGCQMNFADSEIVASILKKEGYTTTQDPQEANLILINTCSIREKAEQTVRKRIKGFKSRNYKHRWNLQIY